VVVSGRGPHAYGPLPNGHEVLRGATHRGVSVDAASEVDRRGREQDPHLRRDLDRRVNFRTRRASSVSPTVAGKRSRTTTLRRVTSSSFVRGSASGRNGPTSKKAGLARPARDSDASSWTFVKAVVNPDSTPCFAWITSLRIGGIVDQN
jgi:hypothetical protein